MHMRGTLSQREDLRYTENLHTHIQIKSTIQSHITVHYKILCYLYYNTLTYVQEKIMLSGKYLIFIIKNFLSVKLAFILHSKITIWIRKDTFSRKHKNKLNQVINQLNNKSFYNIQYKRQVWIAFTSINLRRLLWNTNFPYKNYYGKQT